MAVPRRELDSRSQRVSRLGLDLLASKVRRPPVRPGTVPRPFLIERLRRADRGPIVSVVAPPGYGKTTLLAQWAERNGRSFAWVSVDEADNDPKVLLSYVAEALDAVEPIGERVFDALASPGSSVPGSVVTRLGSAFSSMTTPVALVLDDVHLLRNRECHSALSVLADHVPLGSRLALAGRTAPPLRMARLRAEGRLLEIGPGDLSLTPEEASSLLHNVRLPLDPDDVAELHRRTEGWPVALYLAALCLREGSSVDRTAVSFGGDDRLVSDYVESEFFARISPQQRVFLTRTAVLERMCGPLCDATLGLRGSAETLADLARSNLLLVPLDRSGQWYRYHRLFRDMLLAELRRREPDLIPVLHRRAARWFEANGAPGEALEHQMQAGDTDAVADLAGVLGFPAYQHGRVATVERWFGWLEDRGAMETRPSVAVLAAMLAAMTGKPAEAERCARIAERGVTNSTAPDGSLTTEPWLALLRALLCRDGPEQMRADAELASRARSASAMQAPIIPPTTRPWATWSSNSRSARSESPAIRCARARQRVAAAWKKLPAAMVLAASSASACIRSGPSRQSSARSRASHGSVVGLPSGGLASGGLAPVAPCSAILAHRSASAGFPVMAASIPARTAIEGRVSMAPPHGRPSCPPGGTRPPGTGRPATPRSAGAVRPPHLVLA